tara:strand:- start:10807 stop:12663 length:1857 start_codon:yes stop_codon:yes gene_type:complete
MKKDIKYTGRDFQGLKSNLIEFAKNYFPNTVKDFSDSSPSTMFIEMAAYVGDVLGYYTDYALKETMIHRATEKANVYSIAQSFGYKPKLTTPANTDVDIYALIPATGTGADVRPDWQYAPQIAKGLVATTPTNKIFTSDRAVDFAHSSSFDPTDVTVFSSNATSGIPEFYLVNKAVSVTSGEQRSYSFSVGAAQEYATFTIPFDKVQDIISIIDSDGNEWMEVPFLAQETVFDETVNSVANDPLLSADAINVPYILKLKTTKRRFTTRVTKDDRVEIRFGGGISTNPDESFVPNPDNIGSNKIGAVSSLDKSFDPSNFLYTDTYGQTPANTTLTVTYRVGYGLSANVPARQINKINSKTVTFKPENVLVGSTRQAVIDSIYVENDTAATGGMKSENIEQVRQNAIGHFNTQNRIVTREDYVIRAMSLPSKFGFVAKAFVASDEQMLDEEKSIDNPLAVNLYVLTYDGNQKLTTLSNAAKENLRTYLSQYRLLTDAVNIKDGYIVNLGIDFDITTLPGRNSNQVLVQCIQALKQQFHIDNMSFKSAVYMKDIYNTIANVQGVQSVINVKVRNNFGSEYSSHRYNIDDALYNEVLYPSLDPSVFEILKPDSDIKGRVVQY